MKPHGYSVSETLLRIAKAAYLAKLEEKWGHPVAKTWGDDFEAGWYARDEEVRLLNTKLLAIHLQIHDWITNGVSRADMEAFLNDEGSP